MIGYVVKQLVQTSEEPQITDESRWLRLPHVLDDGCELLPLSRVQSTFSLKGGREESSKCCARLHFLFPAHSYGLILRLTVRSFGFLVTLPHHQTKLITFCFYPIFGTKNVKVFTCSFSFQHTPNKLCELMKPAFPRSDQSPVFSSANDMLYVYAS